METQTGGNPGLRGDALWEGRGVEKAAQKPTRIWRSSLSHIRGPRPPGVRFHQETNRSSGLGLGSVHGQTLEIPFLPCPSPVSSRLGGAGATCGCGSHPGTRHTPSSQTVWVRTPPQQSVKHATENVPRPGGSRSSLPAPPTQSLGPWVEEHRSAHLPRVCPLAPWTCRASATLCGAAWHPRPPPTRCQDLCTCDNHEVITQRPPG